jgi:hypothetical protein
LFNRFLENEECDEEMGEPADVNVEPSASEP